MEPTGSDRKLQSLSSISLTNENAEFIDIFADMLMDPGCFSQQPLQQSAHTDLSFDQNLEQNSLDQSLWTDSYSYPSVAEAHPDSLNLKGETSTFQSSALDAFSAFPNAQYYQESLDYQNNFQQQPQPQTPTQQFRFLDIYAPTNTSEFSGLPHQQLLSSPVYIPPPPPTPFFHSFSAGSTHSTTNSPKPQNHLRSIRNPMIAKDTRVTPSQIMFPIPSSEPVFQQTFQQPSLSATDMFGTMQDPLSNQRTLSSPSMLNYSPPGLLQTPSSLSSSSMAGTGNSVFGHQPPDAITTILDPAQLFSPMSAPVPTPTINQTSITPQSSAMKTLLPATNVSMIADSNFNQSQRMTPMELLNTAVGVDSSNFLTPYPPSPKRKPTTNTERRKPNDQAEKRREYRKEAEKQRRNMLKTGFDTIKELVKIPVKQASKERLLELAFDHITELQQAEKEKETEAKALEAEISILRDRLGQTKENQ